MKQRLEVLLVLTVCLCSASSGKIRKFPKDFKFGAATASYQIEGGWNVTDKGENIWDHLTHTTSLVTDNSNGDIACDSYHNYKRDVEMLVELGVDFYRFSVSWSRVLPGGFADQISVSGLEYYSNLIDELLSNNIEPAVTLYHWDLPQQLQLLGGWTNPVMVDHFAEYARLLFTAYGDRVKTWITFNEPMVFCYMGYGIDEMAPALNMSGIGEYLCSHTMLKAHAEVYHLYDDVFRPHQHGRIALTLNSNWLEPSEDTPEGQEDSERAMEFELGWFANPIYSSEGDYPKIMKDRIAKKSAEQGFPTSRLPEFTPEEIKYIRGTFDFFGINHYTTKLVKSISNDDVVMNPSYEDDRGVLHYQNSEWPGGASPWLKVVPWGFTKLLGWIKTHYNNPEVIVLENGFSDIGGLEDDGRIYYYNVYLNALLDAVDNGSNITGYTAWSLMDNFEWLAGYTERFGLYHVDFEDSRRTRTAKASSLYYRDIIENKYISDSLSDEDLEFFNNDDYFE